MDNSIIHVLHLFAANDSQAPAAQRVVGESSPYRFDHDADAEFRISVAVVRSGRVRSSAVVSDSSARQIDLHEVTRRSRFDPTLLWRVGRLLRRLKPDIVHAHDAQSHLLALLLQPLCGFRMVATARHGHAGDWRERFSASVDQKLLPGFHRVIAANNQLARQLYQLGCRPTQVDVIGVSIDTQRFSRDAVRRQLRDELALSAQAKVVGTSGHLCRGAELDLVLRAVRGAQAAIGPIHLIVFGQYTPRDKIRNRAAKYGLAARTHLIGAQGDLPDVYAALNVFVVAGQSGEVATALLEAQSMEVPVVCTRFEGVEDLVAHGTTGFITDQDDAEALASSITRLLSNPREAQALAATGRLRITQRFHSADRSEALAATYRRAMNQS